MAAAQFSTTDALTDPNSPLVNVSCFDLLLIELVPLAERMARAFEASLDGHGNNATGPTSSSSSSSSSTAVKRAVASGTSAQTASISGAAPEGAGANATSTPLALAADGLPSTTIFRDSVYVRLERLGFRVGEGLSERFSRDRPRFTDHLDVIKFLCKDVWTVVFKKQIDNLKTNHRVTWFSSPSLPLPVTASGCTLHEALGTGYDNTICCSSPRLGFLPCPCRLSVCSLAGSRKGTFGALQ